MSVVDYAKIDDNKMSLVVQFIKKRVCQYIRFGYCFRFYIHLNRIEWPIPSFT
mgnify:CR=1 FL=1